MNATETIKQAISENNGFITRKQVIELGVNPSVLYRLASRGELDKSSYGVYTLPHIFDDEFYNYGTRFKSGIFSLETALFLHNMNDRMPLVYDMSFPLNYGISNLPNNINAVRESEKFYGMGSENLKTPSGNIVKAYSIERTLCDIIRTTNKVDIQIIVDAFKLYSKQPVKDIQKIYEYAILLGVKQKIRNYLEVLL
ncbi:MAG: type IV toxin-antitoxin system AbiEi family antitoxin domain-containing protein [Candidatus Ancillula sp.]|jgi:predicted transcriptional regulator of viral defense system|nr:type IV toxin-antitoxin system AbiEi family antitoxin domain-containing protein [Candidatus Ancillula sp.]